MDLAPVMAHDGLEGTRLQNGSVLNKDNVVAAYQKRDAIRDKDPRFCRKQSAWSYDMICKGFITQITSKTARCQPTIDMTSNVGIDSGQYIVWQHQVRTSIDSASKSNPRSFPTTQLLDMSTTFGRFKTRYPP